MRKYITIFVMVIFSILIVGCTNSQDAPPKINDENPDDKINIVTTGFAPYDFAREISGDHANITMLLPPASESHSFEPTPKDIITIGNCDVFIYVGGKSDDWVDGVLSSVDTSDIEIITLMDCVDVVEEEIVEGMQEDEHHHEEDHHDEEHHDEDHHDDHELDEHVWTSPLNAKLIVEKISEAICIKDSANVADYEKNTAEYLNRLDELDTQFQEVVDSGARKTLVFGDRFPFRYFADRYGLEYFAAFPGCSTETEPSADTIAFLIDKVGAEKIPVVLSIELSNGKITNTICESTGAIPMTLHSCHNISKEDFESGVSYMDLMEKNVAVLREALK